MKKETKDKLKLTTEEKLEAYEYALEQLKKVVDCGVCVLFDRWFDMEGITIPDSYEETVSYFPEFLKYKPRNKKKGSKWWGFNDQGLLRRTKVLGKIIEKLKKD